MSVSNAGHLTDAQARNLVIKSLRKARAAYRAADTMGEKEEREYDRLIKRKTRINASSLLTLAKRYTEYQKLVAEIQLPLTDAYAVASEF
jgi:hypothetical protein